MQDRVSSHKDMAEAQVSESPFGNFLDHAVKSFKYNLYQAPVTGAAQLVDHVADTHFAKDLKFCKPPRPAGFGSPEWLGDTAGGTVAAAIQLGALHRFVGVAAAARYETSNAYGLKTALPSVMKSAGTGLLLGGVFSPSEEGSNFWTQRKKHALTTAATFGTMTAGSVWLRSTGMRSDVLANTLSGGVGGFVDSDLNSLLTNGEFSSWSDRVKSMTTFAAGGAMAGLANHGYEYLRPTSGMRGVRTTEDMIRLADSMKIADGPKPFERTQNVSRPRAEELIANDKPLDDWKDRAVAAVRKEMNNTTSLTVEQKKVIISSLQQSLAGLEALNNRPNPRPIMTVYGSARFRPGDFRFERARYLGGLAVANGYDVMTGGAPSGTMLAANQGAYEAGGNSIGVTIKLPFENADTPVGYQTLTINCRDFPVRMMILKSVTNGEFAAPQTASHSGPAWGELESSLEGHDQIPGVKIDIPPEFGKTGVFVVEEGGLGTGAEGLDTLTYMQCNKLQKAPVYFVGKKAYADLDHHLRNCIARGTMSPNDLHLYRIVDDPREIFEDLPNRYSEIARLEAEARMKIAKKAAATK